MNALHSLVARALGTASTQAEPLVRPADVLGTTAEPIVAPALPVEVSESTTTSPVDARSRHASPESTTSVPRRTGEPRQPPVERVMQSIAAPPVPSSRAVDAPRTDDAPPRVVTHEVRLRERVEREIHSVHERVTQTIVVPAPAAVLAAEAPRESATNVEAAVPAPAAAPVHRPAPNVAATPTPRAAATRDRPTSPVSRVVTPPPQQSAPTAPPMREAEAVAAPSSAPVVHVHIDRIVVHANPPAPQAMRTTASPPPGPDQLARYLEERAKR